MDKKSLIGFLLIGLLLVLFQIINRPSQEELDKRAAEKQQTEQAQQAQGQAEAGDASSPNSTNSQANKQPVSSAETLQQFAQNTGEAASFSTLENDQLKVTFSSKGGAVSKVELKEFKTSDGDPVFLVDDPRNEFTYEFSLNNKPFSSQDFNFKVQEQNDQGITFRLSAGDGGYIEQVYRFADDPYTLDYDLNIVGLQSQMNQKEIELNWKSYLIQQEADINNERIKTAIYYRDADEDVEYLKERSDDEDELEKAQVSWLGMKQQFFNNTLISKSTDLMQAGKISSKSPTAETDTTLKALTAQLYLPYNQQQNFNYPMAFYMGPNHYNTLKAKGIGMERQVYMGWSFIRWVNLGLIVPIFNFLNKFIGNYGIIILLLTLFIKMMLLPLTYRSYKSMAKMNVLKPEIEELKKKHPDDMQKQQQETMKLYGKVGVSPLGGCLPQMLQMPILIAMYYFFPSALELRQESFLWAHDLSTYDSILNLPFTIPFYGAHVSLFTLLSAGASLIYTQMNAQLSGTGSNPQMKMIQYFMPLFLIFIFNSFPAALTFYFFLSNIITFGQQMFIKKFLIDDEKIRAQLMEKAKQPNTKKKGKFQQRLANMMKEQQRIAEQKAKEGKAKKK